MITTPVAARGLVDPTSGSLLVVGADRLYVSDRAERLLEVTPEHPVDCVAIGGGAVAVAGGAQLTWQGPAGPVTTEAPLLYRVAVSGALVAGVSAEGDVSVWASVSAAPLLFAAALEPDGVAVDPARGRVAVWGWREERAVLLVLEMRTSGLVALGEAWPEPAAGVAFPLHAGQLAVAAQDDLIMVDAAGRRRGELALTGLEDVAGAGYTVAWLRTDDGGADAGGPVVVGAARVDQAGAALDVIGETTLPMAGPVALAVTEVGGILVVEGRGADRVVVYSLSGPVLALSSRVVSLPSPRRG